MGCWYFNFTSPSVETFSTTSISTLPAQALSFTEAVCIKSVACWKIDLDYTENNMSPSAANANGGLAAAPNSVPAKDAKNGNSGTPEVARLPIPGPKMYNHKIETEGNERWPPATVIILFSSS